MVGFVPTANIRKKMTEKTRSEWERDLEVNTCCLCECDSKAHVIYWECPLFLNYKICQRCCQIDTLRHDVANMFSKRLGRRMTLAEINEACKDCGKNYATQNEQLADDLENPEKDNEVNREKDTEEERR